MPNIKNVKDYFIGLDIGTNSIGWAVTDTNYNVLKFNGKDMWGSRLFDEAQTAAERRLARIARRLNDKKKQRINFLNSQFVDELNKKDPGFLQRLRESKFLEEFKEFSDISLNSKNILFNDKDLTDYTYRSKYPTIYHLRKALIENDKDAFDIRFVYLAIHHILKHRGNFLYNDINISDNKNQLFTELNNQLEQVDLEKFDFTSDIIQSFIEIASNSQFTLTTKHAKLAELLKIDKKDKRYNLIKLISGSSIKLSKLFDLELEKDNDCDISFKKELEDILSGVEENAAEYLDLVIISKNIHDICLLNKFMSNNKYISFAKVKTYEKHKNDLKMLKELLKDNKDAYQKAFSGPSSYQNYVLHLDNKNKKEYKTNRDILTRCTYEDFIKNIKPIVDSYLKATESKDPSKVAIAKKIMQEIELQNFLPKQRVVENSVIPHQIHLLELQTILDNASKYFNFLNEKDETCLNVKEKIIKTFEFTVPYYVGPLNQFSKNSWVVRSDDKITPWNFEKVVNVQASAEEFIKRMTQKCSYLGTESLPKESLLYSKFIVLNKINCLQINNQRISVDIKQKLFNELYLKQKTVTYKDIKKFFVNNGFMSQEDNLSGMDSSNKDSLKFWIELSWLINKSSLDGFEVAEDIIKRSTLFPNDQKMLKKYITDKYSDKLSEDDINRLSRIKASGWGNLSKELLTDIKHKDEDDGINYSIIDFMFRHNLILIEVLSNKFTFNKQIENKISSNMSISIEEAITNSYNSPSVKRSMIQCYKIVKELVKIAKHEPKRIFIEMTRHDKEKKATKSRKDALLENYNKLKMTPQLEELKKELEDASEKQIQKDKIYLYFVQQGQCMYTNTRLNLNELDQYDIDHIYPQELIKDDSLVNRVLVHKSANAKKSNKYPLDSEIQKQKLPFWKYLLDNGFISKEKFLRLTRHVELTQEELAGFIQRQLVITGQATKFIANILNTYLNNTTVVYSKAQNVNIFKNSMLSKIENSDKQDKSQKYLYFKNRDINDLHHAKDAYLNIVVGNCYHAKFGFDPLEAIKRETSQSKNTRIFKYEIFEKGQIAWHPDKTPEVVEKYLAKNTCLLSYMTIEKNGKFFTDQYKITKNCKIPLKTSDERFKLINGKFLLGGFKNASMVYFAVISYSQKGKTKKDIIGIPIHHKNSFEANPVEYVNNLLNVNDATIIMKLPYNSIISINNCRFIITGKSDRTFLVQAYMPLILEPYWSFYLSKINRAIKSKSETIYDSEITSEKNLKLYDLLIEKTKVKQFNLMFNNMGCVMFNKRNSFIKNSLKNQCSSLLTLVKEFRNQTNLYIKSCELKSNRQRIGFNYVLDGSVIYLSVTGLFDKEVKI